MDNDTLWQTALGELEVTLSKANYTTWLKGSFIQSINNSVATIGVPNNFSKEWLRKKFHTQIIDTLNKLTDGVVLSVEYVVATKNGQPKDEPSSPLIPNPVDKNPTPVRSKNHTQQTPKLNPKYTFAHFIVGNSNKMAHAAAEAVAASPGMSYNPLFLYGGVGLGKTHLIQAIAHRVLENDPSKQIVYCSSEQFTNEFVESLRKGQMADFKRQYRDVDLLLIDDIQFIAGKETIQEEFFHTFNAIHQQNHQIIITSDRIPKAIPTLEERLSSRFEMGLIVDINPPDFETRCAVIQAKALEKKFALDNKLVVLMAETIPSNMRELEGALNKLIAHCNFHRIEPTEAVIHECLQQYMVAPVQKSVSVNKILKMVAAFYNLTMDELQSSKRTKELVYPRHVAMHLLRTEMNLSYPTIGKEIGGKDHTTVMSACNKMEKEVKKNDNLQQEITTLKERLYTA